MTVGAAGAVLDRRRMELMERGVPVMPLNGMAACAAGKCSIRCSDGFQACGSACIDTQSDANNCGACGMACDEQANGRGACVAGVCRMSCDTGFALCDGGCVDTLSPDIRPQDGYGMTFSTPTFVIVRKGELTEPMVADMRAGPW